MKAILFILLIIVIIALAPVLVMWAWGWIVPDVFSGAVEHGVLPASISYIQAWKLVILLAVLGLTGKGGNKK